MEELTPESFMQNALQIQSLIEENELLRREIRVAREAAEITANLVAKQFEETEKILRRFQIANSQRKAVLDSASEISIIATNTDGIIIVFNRGAENLLGYYADEIIGRQTPEIFHLESELVHRANELSARYGSEIKGLDVFFTYATQAYSGQREWTYVRKDGTKFPVNMSINVLRESDWAVSGFLCIAMDISEKKRSEKALQESEGKYRVLINNLPNIVFKGYSDGSMEIVDDKIASLTGYDKEEFISGNMNWYDLIVEEDFQAAKEKFRQALNSDGSYIREYRLKSKNGGIIWIEEGSQIIYDENGKIDYVTGAFLDITERKMAENAFHGALEKFRSLFDSGPNPIFVLDRITLEILDANPRAESTYGYSRNELIGKPFNDLGSFEYETKELDHAEKDGPFMGRVTNKKVRHFKKGQRPFYVNLVASPTNYEGREALILAVTDITEMMEKDAQLIQASKMTSLGEMSAGIAHELNQPLNTINIGSEFLQKMVTSGKEIPEKDLLTVVSEMSGQVQRASEIINRLRDFGRKPDLAKKKIDINSPIRGVIKIIGRQLNLLDIELVLELEEKLPPVLAHHNHLEQVIFNLLSNARDAITQAGVSDGSRITIKSFVEKGRVTITVSDTGIGIPNEAKDKIFEPFFTTKEVGKGMGLGLSIIYGIIRDHGGEIDFQSKKGTGSSFKLSFPPAPYFSERKRSCTRS